MSACAPFPHQKYLAELEVLSMSRGSESTFDLFSAPVCAPWLSAGESCFKKIACINRIVPVDEGTSVILPHRNPLLMTFPFETLSEDRMHHYPSAPYVMRVLKGRYHHKSTFRQLNGSKRRVSVDSLDVKKTKIETREGRKNIDTDPPIS